MKHTLTVLSTLLLFLPATATSAEPIGSDHAQVGDRAPIFSLVSAHGDLINYDQDYYGRHHLILTFFPAAFTPV